MPDALVNTQDDDSPVSRAESATSKLSKQISHHFRRNFALGRHGTQGADDKQLKSQALFKTFNMGSVKGFGPKNCANIFNSLS